MRKIILFNMVSVDGFFEASNADLSWHNVDGEFNDFAMEQLNAAGGLIFGRITYQLMSAYWPTVGALEDDPVVARRMNDISKIVFSKTLERVDWENTRLVRGDLAGEIQRLKQQPGQDLLIFGSAGLAAGLTRLALIDEYRLMVNPVLLGGGRPLFQELPGSLGLDLLDARPFRSGNVLLSYRPRPVSRPAALQPQGSV
jgi:dihydrofolate reductase